MLGGASASENNIHHEEVVLKAATGAQRKKSKNKNIINNSNSRRFSDEQIKSLESLFKMENKLEPRKKLEMARELGLHPRQVAIWFQNRRARWKSKQVEQDYTSLKADYDTLSDRFESLKKEKHALLEQLRDLCSQLKEPHMHEGSSKDLDSGSEDGDTNCELNGNYSSGFSGALEQQDMAIYSDEDDPRGKHMISSRKEESENVNANVHQLISHDHDDDEKASNYDLSSLFDQSCSNWWDLWSSNS